MAQLKVNGTDPQAPRQKILRIGVLLGGKIVEEKLIRERDTVSLGQSSRNTFSIPSTDLPKSWPLFEMRNGQYLLNLGEGMDGRVSEGGPVQTLQQLRAAGQARQVGQHWQVPLTENARGKIVLGDLTLLFQYVLAPPIQPKPQLPASVRGTLSDRIDPYMAVILALSLLVHGGVGTYIWNMDVPAPPQPDEIPDRFAKAVMTPPVVVKPKPVAVVATGPATDAGAKDPGPKKPAGGDGGKKPDKKPGGDAPPDSAAVAQAVQNTAVLKVLGARSSSGTGAFVDVTGGKDAGGDLSKGLQNVGKSGATVAMTGGSALGGGTRGPATGQIGTGKYAGVSGPVGPGGDVGGPKGEEEIKFSVGTGSISDIDSGGLDPNKVAATIKNRYAAGVKQCYQRGLKGNPKLSGKVEVTFTVGPAGNVTKVSISEGVDPGVDQCVATQARGWRFDKPEGGSAEFVFPFILRAGS